MAIHLFGRSIPQPMTQKPDFSPPGRERPSDESFLRTLLKHYMELVEANEGTDFVLASTYEHDGKTYLYQGGHLTDEETAALIQLAHEWRADYEARTGRKP